MTSAARKAAPAAVLKLAEKQADPLVVTLTTTALADLMREQVAEALAEHRESEAPEKLLLGVSKMAELLDISRSTLDRLRLEGCPAVPVGDVFKFEPAEVLRWLKERKQP